MKNRSLSFCLWLITAWLVAGCGVEASETPPVAADVCAVKFALPPGAIVNIDGRDYGEKERVTFDSLKAGQYRFVEAVVRQANGKSYRRKLLLRGGWTVHVPEPPPSPPALEISLAQPALATCCAISSDGQRCLTGGHVDRKAVL
jgi:hypothetical protein